MIVCIHKRFLQKAKEQIAAIICSDQKEFSINIKPVQRQKGGADCGLFAIAYAQSLCNVNYVQVQASSSYIIKTPFYLSFFIVVIYSDSYQL